MFRHVCSAVLVGVACGTAAPSARADQITFAHVFTVDQVSGGTFVLSGFDETLGSLNSATVAITTDLMMRVLSHDAGIPGFPIAVPYDFTVDQQLRLRGPDGQVFLETDRPATFRVQGSSLTNLNVVDTQYAYAFTIDAASDLNGFAPIQSLIDPGPFTAPATASGALADFEFLQVPGLFVASNYRTNFTGLGGAPEAIGRIIDFSTTHTIAVTYDYTPHSVPEPGTLALLGLGFAAQVAFHRRRRANP